MNATYQKFDTRKDETDLLGRTPAFILVKQLCEKHNLSKEVEDEIMEIVKQSYIRGSNDNYDSLRKYLK